MNLPFPKFVRFTATGLFVLLAQGAVAAPAGTDAEIRSRIAPIGNLRTAESGEQEGSEGADQEVALTPAAAEGGLSGEETYNTYCVACHAAGVAGAPKYGDAEAWEPRLAKGIETLYESTYNGLNIMPPRGTCSQCSDEDLRNAVDYMVSAVQ
ncbi:MAG: c-type cytochrome [Pseudomonadales bacterium]|jgi:cytochrome c5|nr:c-type cytochrome [Pseudomonadales bacterium]